MPRLSKLVKTTEPFSVTVFGETITGRYRPYVMTGKHVDEIAKAAEKATKASTEQEAYVYAQGLADMISEWDLVGDDEKPIPLTREAIRKELPLRLMIDILQGVVKAQSPPAVSSGRSRGSFGAEDDQGA